MSFCLPKFAADLFREKLINGEFNPERLAQMTSEARRKAFVDAGISEQNAKQVNALFESKLLLKNQQAGMIRWAQQLLAMKPEALRDTLSKVERLGEVLTPEELDAYLSDLVEKKLGIGVSVEEAGKLADLAKRVEDARAKIPENAPDGSPEVLEYGLNLALFKDYVEALKVDAMTPTLKDYYEHKTRFILDTMGVIKSIKASFDNSFFGRQGIKMLFTNPDIWANAFKKSWGDGAKAIIGKDPTLAIRADIFSRKNARNGIYQKSKLAIGIGTEEAFPSMVHEKIPVLGNLFKASEKMYNGAALRMRADLMDRVLKTAEENGVDITDKTELESLGKLVNSMTGRGSIGKLEVIGKEINAALFSIKYLKSNIDVLTAHAFDTQMSRYAKQQAAKNLLKITLGIATTLYLANQLWPKSVEQDPRSSDFGKIRIGNTRFDISGGMTGLVVLASRLIPVLWGQGATKNTTTKKVTPLNSGKFGALTGWDVFTNFWEGKTSPAISTLIAVMKGKDFQGKKLTVSQAAQNLLVPMPIMTWQEMQNDPKSADILISNILSALGIGVNTYTPTKK